MVTSSITAKPGRNLVLKVADPDVSPSSYVTVGGLRNNQVTINNNPVDITNNDSGGLREYLPDGGVQSYDFTMDGVLDISDAGFKILEEEARARRLVDIQLVSGHGDSYLFAVAIISLQRAGNTNDAETFNATMSSHGSITYVPA